MRQTRKQAFAETCVSTAIGFVVAYATTAVVLPLFGYPVSGADNVWITATFTAVSIARGMAVRRAFDWWHHRGVA